MDTRIFIPCSGEGEAHHRIRVPAISYKKDNDRFHEPSVKLFAKTSTCATLPYTIYCAAFVLLLAASYLHHSILVFAIRRALLPPAVPSLQISRQLLTQYFLPNLSLLGVYRRPRGWRGVRVLWGLALRKPVGLHAGIIEIYCIWLLRS